MGKNIGFPSFMILALPNSFETNYEEWVFILQNMNFNGIRNIQFFFLRHIQYTANNFEIKLEHLFSMNKCKEIVGIIHEWYSFKWTTSILYEYIEKPTFVRESHSNLMAWMENNIFEEYRWKPCFRPLSIVVMDYAWNERTKKTKLF